MIEALLMWILDEKCNYDYSERDDNRKENKFEINNKSFI